MKQRYSLELTDTHKWFVITSEGLGRWLRKFAYILGLAPCRTAGSPRLIFVQGGGQKDYFNDARNWYKSCDFRSLKLWRNDRMKDIICELDRVGEYKLDIVKMQRSLYPIYAQVVEGGGIPLHAALIKKGRAGILLAAPGGVGKSTCCNRIPPPWEALCDEEVLIVREGKRGYFAHPFPTWSDYFWRDSSKQWNVQEGVSLSTLFFLERAEKDGISLLDKPEAVAFINNSAAEVCRRYWVWLSSEERLALKKRLFNNACQVAKTASTFILRVSIGGSFWEEMEKVVK